jgi:hypothetical protein
MSNFDPTNQSTNAQAASNFSRDFPSSFKKAVILEIILEPSMITETKKAYYNTYNIINFNLLHEAPKNSYIAKLLSTQEDAANIQQNFSYILAPFFPPHLALPCKPGEVVWAFFDNTTIENNFGYWVCKITTSGLVEDVNYTHYPRQFDYANRDRTDREFVNAQIRQIERLNQAGLDRTLTSENTAQIPSAQNIFSQTFVPRRIDHTFLNKATKLDNSFQTTQTKDYEFIKDKTFIKNIYSQIATTGADVDPSFYIDNPFSFILTQTDASKMMSYEAVPSYLKKPSDIVFEGSNNNLIVLGTETEFYRYSMDSISIIRNEDNIPRDDFDNKGTVDILTGIRNRVYDIDRITNEMLKKERKKFPVSENKFYTDLGIPDTSCTPTFRNTKSRIYVSQKTNPDKMMDIIETIPDEYFEDLRGESVDFYYHADFLYDYNKKVIGSDVDTAGAAIIQKSDKIRIVARRDIQFIVKQEDENGDLNDDINNYSSITIKSNGDIILKPSDKGLVKIGGEDADKVPLCASVFTITPTTSNIQQTLVKGQPILTTGGHEIGLGVYSGSMPLNSGEKQEIISGSYGIFASRVLIK